MTDDREYARRFALEHAHYRADLPYWRAAVERLGGPVLDVGCATGRVTLDLASAGVSVHALDRSAAMLSELERAAREQGIADLITTHRADMRTFEIGRTFPLVVVPMNTFQLLHEPIDQRAALTALRSHLAPGGELILEVARPHFDQIDAALGTLLPSGSHCAPDETLLLHSSRYDALDRARHRARFTLRIDHVPDRGRPPVERTFDVRLFGDGELAAVAEPLGLELIADEGGFDGTPPGPDSEIQLLRFRGRA